MGLGGTCLDTGPPTPFVICLQLTREAALPLHLPFLVPFLPPALCQKGCFLCACDHSPVEAVCPSLY